VFHQLYRLSDLNRDYRKDQLTREEYAVKKSKLVYDILAMLTEWSGAED
jgi:hypothetical protein